jgi:hypothetical protein
LFVWGKYRHISVYTCGYNLNWYIHSIFLLSILVPFLWWKFYIHSCIESTPPIFTFLASFFYLLSC